MAKAYLIGGTPRCGKTSIALAALKVHPMFATSTDSIRYTLRDVLTKENVPDLFAAHEKFTEESIVRLCSSGKSSEIVEWQNKESRVVWKSVQRCIEGFIAEDLDILVEGVAILPEFLSQLTCEYSAVFVGNTDPSHVQHMLEYARSGRYDWMSAFNDETIRQFGQFTSVFSKYLQTESEKHGYRFVDMAQGDYEATKIEVVKQLLGNF